MLAPSLSSFQETSPLAVVRMGVMQPTADTRPSALYSPPPLRAELESIPTERRWWWGGGEGGSRISKWVCGPIHMPSVLEEKRCKCVMPWDRQAPNSSLLLSPRNPQEEASLDSWLELLGLSGG